MEKYSSMPNYFKKGVLCCLAVLSMSFVNNDVYEAYEALDSYKNIVFVLNLNKDNTFIFQEKFLDGSVWTDEGKWFKNGDKIKLTSLRKTKREHNYLKFDKAYKFKGDEFVIAGDTLKYVGRGNQQLNDYLRKLLIIKAKAAHDLKNVSAL